MKKATAIIMAIALTVAFSVQTWSQTTGSVSRKEQATTSTQQEKSVQGKFVDKNNNGVCDNYESRGNGGKGRNFVDKNGDGKCDHCQGNCLGQGKGNCCGKGMGYGKQGGQGFCGGGQGFRHRHGCQGTSQAPVKPATESLEKK